MSDSIQSQIVAKVVALLGAAGPWNAYRTRMEAFNPSQLPAFNVLPDSEQPSYIEAGGINRKFRFFVRHMAAAANEVDAAVDALYVAGQKALLADPKLGGLVWYTREIDAKWELEKGSQDQVAKVVTYEVEFATSRSDPSVSVP